MNGPQNNKVSKRSSVAFGWTNAKTDRDDGLDLLPKMLLQPPGRRPMNSSGQVDKWYRKLDT